MDITTEAKEVIDESGFMNLDLQDLYKTKEEKEAFEKVMGVVISSTNEDEMYAGLLKLGKEGILPLVKLFLTVYGI